MNNWDIRNVTQTSSMFADSVFNGNISDWNVSHIGSFDEVFKGAIYFNQDISRWDVSNLTNMYGTFNGAINFNQDLSIL